MDRVGGKDGEMQETDKDMRWGGGRRLKGKKEKKRERKQAEFYAFSLLV